MITKRIINKFIIVIGLFCVFIILLSLVPAKMPFYDEAYPIYFTNSTSEDLTFITITQEGTMYRDLNFLKTPFFLGIFSSLNINDSITRYYDYYGDNMYLFAKGENDSYLKNLVSHKNNNVILTNDDNFDSTDINLNYYNLIFPVGFYLVISLFIFLSAKIAKSKPIKYFFFVFGFIGCIFFIGHLAVFSYLLSWI